MRDADDDDKYNKRPQTEEEWFGMPSLNTQRTRRGYNTSEASAQAEQPNSQSHRTASLPLGRRSACCAFAFC